MPTNTGTPYAAVDCRLHGTVDIDRDEYLDQLTNVRARWKCPVCKADAEFNEQRYDELNPQPED